MRVFPSTFSSLSASMAADVSAFLTANVPPKPQHSSPSGSSTRSMLRTARRSPEPERRVADPEEAERVARRVVRDPMRERGADVLEPERAGQELGELEDARGERCDLGREPVVARELVSGKSVSLKKVTKRATRTEATYPGRASRSSVLLCCPRGE
jgi:hypothetical protein